MKPVLLFDIDRTLFDTDSFIQTYQKKLIKFLNTTPEKYEKIRSKYHESLVKHTDYAPEEFLKHLVNFFHLPATKAYEKLHNLYYETENFSHNLFPDTIPSLTELKLHYQLGIYSEGLPTFQKTKLVKSHLYDFFNPKYIFISKRKLEPATFNFLPTSCTIVDDDLSVIDELLAQKTKSLNLIWLNRKTKQKHPHIKTIHSLTELI